MEQLSEKRRRNSIRIAIGLAAIVLLWYVVSIYVVLQS
jgi:hypothetical protein